MKTLVFGDTHGRPYWQTILQHETYDKVIFIGDYFDSYQEYSAVRQLHNFKAICNFKKSAYDKEIILLFGNHDYHYLPGVEEHYSGYQTKHAFQIGQELKENLNLFQICHVQGSYIFTHAGLTNTWCRNNDINLNNLEQSVNDLFKFKPLSFGFTIGNNWDETGDDPEQGPLWVRPNSLQQDAIPGIHVNGHTRVKRISCWDDKFWLIDAMEIGQYLSIENDKAEVKTFIIVK